MARRKTKHPGVWSLGDGRYLIRAYAKDSKTGRMREAERTVEAKHAGEAAGVREGLVQELRRGGVERPSRTTLRQYALSWLAAKGPELKPSTRKTYAEAISLHILPTLGDYYVDQLSLSDLVEWRDAQRGAAETVNGRLRVLKTIVRSAVHDLGLPIDPTVRLAPLRRPPHDGPGKSMTADELAGILGALRLGSPQWYPLCLTLALTGLRWGEVTALKWEDVDLEAGVIRVRRAQWHGRVDSTKNETRRAVPIADLLRDVLLEHREAQVRHQVRGLKEGWVFSSRKGTRPYQSILTKPLRSAAVACGMARWLPGREGKEAEGRVPTPHWFRHTFNNLVRRVAKDQVVRAMTGHLTEEMTEHYSYISMDERRNAVAQVIGMVRPPTPE